MDDTASNYGALICTDGTICTEDVQSCANGDSCPSDFSVARDICWYTDQMNYNDCVSSGGEDCSDQFSSCTINSGCEYTESITDDLTQDDDGGYTVSDFTQGWSTGEDDCGICENYKCVGGSQSGEDCIFDDDCSDIHIPEQSSSKIQSSPLWLPPTHL
jgi:hypothetical protein